MKIEFRTSILLFAAPFFILFGSTQAMGTAFVVFHPADAADTVESVIGAGNVVVNPTLDPVMSDEDYSHTNGADVDENTGLIRGYSGYRLDAARAVTRTENLIGTFEGTNDPALVANMSGLISYDATLSGTGQSLMTVFADVDGSFNYDVGSPALGLSGGVIITVTPAGNPLATRRYSLAGRYLNFDDQDWMPDSNVVVPGESFQVFDAFSNLIANPNLNGVWTQVEFLSTNANALSMRIGITVPVSGGDTVNVFGAAIGSATHAFLEDFRELNVGETGNVDAAEGYVDFLNTASLGVLLVDGFTLEGADAPPLSIVPEPGFGPLMAAGVLALGVVSRQRGRRT
ncbi:MAG: hypothetical protein AB8G23_05375 [Myxococcota bacterium]